MPVFKFDCQFHTDHLESMGGEYISWTEYRGMLLAGIEYDVPPEEYELPGEYTEDA